MSEALKSAQEASSLLLQQRFTGALQWWASAPGRVNLIGDHTDYSGGFALPMAVDLYTLAAATPSADNRIRVYSTAQGDAVIPLREGGPRVGDWSDYLRGVCAGYEERGIVIPGMDVVIGGDLPLGAGLSSSASLELCFAALIEQASGHSLDPTARALLCQQAEHDYAGVPCGILDQFAISFATSESAMLLDCRSQKITRVALPDGICIAIVESGVSHALNDGGYAQRRQQVQEAETLLGKSLRDCNTTDIESLADERLRRRARHVVTENQRVQDFAGALNNRNVDEAGALMYASHRSLAEDFEVSCHELDVLVQAARDAQAIGARMTGGGFGGSMVALVLPDARDAFMQGVHDAYSKNTGKTPKLRWVTPSTGVQAWSTA